MRKLSPDQTKHIAKLCNINLQDIEIEKLSAMLGEAIDYIDNLNELDTSKISETYQVTGQVNVFQKENEVSDALSQDQALFNAKIKKNKLIGTKAVFHR